MQYPSQLVKNGVKMLVIKQQIGLDVEKIDGNIVIKNRCCNPCENSGVIFSEENAAAVCDAIMAEASRCVGEYAEKQKN